MSIFTWCIGLIRRRYHLPLIVNWSTGRYRRHETDDLVDFTDVLSTISDIVGRKIPQAWDVDGHSFFHHVKGEKGKAREWIFSHYSPIHSADANRQSARFFSNHRYKLYHDGRFYDLSVDPEQNSPIAKGAGSKEAEKVRRAFEKELAKLPSWQPGDAGVSKVVLPGLEPLASFYE